VLSGYGARAIEPGDQSALVASQSGWLWSSYYDAKRIPQRKCLTRGHGAIEDCGSTRPTSSEIQPWQSAGLVIRDYCNITDRWLRSPAFMEEFAGGHQE